MSVPVQILISVHLYFYRLILLPDQAKASLATHYLAYIKGIGYNTKYEASNNWLYSIKKKFTLELYFPYCVIICVAYYDDIIKNMTCSHCRNSILYVTYLPFGDWHTLRSWKQFNSQIPMEGRTGSSIRRTGILLSCSNSIHISKWLLKKIIVKYWKWGLHNEVQSLS